MAGTVVLDREFPACATAGTGAGALVRCVSLMDMLRIDMRISYWTDAECVLRDGGVVALRVEPARRRLDLAVATAPGIGRAVLCEGS